MPISGLRPQKPAEGEAVRIRPRPELPVVASLAMVGTGASQGSPPTRSRRHWPDPRITRLVVVGAAVIYAIVFIALNRNDVRIHFVFFTVTTRLWVGFLVCVALGTLLGHAVGVYRRRRGREGGPGAGSPAPR